MKNSLSFKVKKRKFKDLGDAIQNERTYFDFQISGESLSEILNIENQNLIGFFGWGINPKYELEVLNEFVLKKKTELESGRTMVYGCPECGDVGCGAITVKIEKENGKFIWKEFGYEDGFDEDIEYKDLKEIGPFEFEEYEYYQVIEKIKKGIERGLKGL